MDNFRRDIETACMWTLEILEIPQYLKSEILEGINNRVNATEDRIGEFEDRRLAIM